MSDPYPEVRRDTRAVPRPTPRDREARACAS